MSQSVEVIFVEYSVVLRNGLLWSHVSRSFALVFTRFYEIYARFGSFQER